MDGFSWLAVVVGAAAFFFLGAAWYSVLFRDPWAADMGFGDDLPETPQAPPVSTMLGSFGAALVLAGVLEWLVRDCGVAWGAKVGLAVGVAIAAVMAQNALYDSRPRRLYLINGGYPLVGAVVVGIVTGAI